MRFCDLKGLSDEQANKCILECQRLEFSKILKNPEILSEKVLVFRGNYDGFATNRLCARTFEYIAKEDRWLVSDVTIYDLFTSSFDYHFKREEVELKFEAFCRAKGFLMDA